MVNIVNRIISRTKIDFCGYTWNPVWGCLGVKNGDKYTPCPYCYARTLGTRFGHTIVDNEIEYLYKTKDDIMLVEEPIDSGSNYCIRQYFYKIMDKFEPLLLKHNLSKEMPKKNSIIFVNSMSEVAQWNICWLNQVLDKIRKYPQHTFIFLTKDHDAYEAWDRHNTDNVIYGYTACNQKMSDSACDHASKISKDSSVMLNIEPMLEKVTLSYNHPFNWVIIGAETGNRKGKVKMKYEWLAELLYTWDDSAVFMKGSVKKYLDEDKFIQKYPDDIIKRKE